MGKVRTMTKNRVHVLVEGRVQGVGYRMYVRNLADRYGISGWVRNRVDGSVEAEIEGELEVVKTFMELLHARSSPVIRVDRITPKTTDPKNDSGFEIR